MCAQNEYLEQSNERWPEVKLSFASFEAGYVRKRCPSGVKMWRLGLAIGVSSTASHRPSGDQDKELTSSVDNLVDESCFCESG